jgi:hypothetical protein
VPQPYQVAPMYQTSVFPPSGSPWAKVLAAWDGSYTDLISVPALGIVNYAPDVTALETIGLFNEGDDLSSGSSPPYPGPTALTGIYTFDATGANIYIYSPDVNGNLQVRKQSTAQTKFGDFVIAVISIMGAAIGGAAIAGAGAAGAGTGVVGSAPVDTTELASDLPSVTTDLPTIPTGDLPTIDPLQTPDIPQIDTPTNITDALNTPTLPEPTPVDIQPLQVPDIPQIDTPNNITDALNGSGPSGGLTWGQIASGASTIAKLVGALTGKTVSSNGTVTNSATGNSDGSVTITSAGSIGGLAIMALAAYLLVKD